ncbi:MAG: hypothetical protein JWN46_832 [Acidimicrobiales bacterium]|nr:hypothetical protein [Acidimicrobiales bacterium]
MGDGRRRASASVAVALALVTLSVASPARASAPSVPARIAPRAGCAPGPFSAEVERYVEGRWPGHHLTANVVDEATGCEYQYHPERRLTTASVIKVEIMAGILLRAQEQGRGVTQWEADRLWGMITESLTPPTQDLWTSLGGVPAMRALDGRFGLTETDAQGWPSGNTVTSAHDRTRLILQVLGGAPSPLSRASRDTAHFYMTHVTPSQRWGIAAGVPAGWDVANKNGFYPSPCCAWRIGSTGRVSRPGAAYAVTIMSDGWPSDRPGIDAVELLGRIIAVRFAPAPVPPFRSADAATVQQYADLVRARPDVPTRLYVDALLSGDPSGLPQLADTLLATPSTAADERIVRLYLASFGRVPPLDELDWYSALVRGGAVSTDKLAAQFAATTAFATRYKAPDDGGFLDALTRATLGRVLDPGGRTYWLGVLAGHGRAGVVLRLSDSGEYRARHRGATDATVVYRVLLRRTPDLGALGTWSAAATRPSYVRRLMISVVLASTEYRVRVGA